MDIQVQARHMNVTDTLREHVASKVSKLERFYDSLLSIEVILDKQADMSVVEIVATAKKKNKFVATDRHEDMYTCIDQCLHKISEQVRRHKDKVRDRQGPSHGQTSEAGE